MRWSWDFWGGVGCSDLKWWQRQSCDGQSLLSTGMGVESPWKHACGCVYEEVSREASLRRESHLWCVVASSYRLGFWTGWQRELAGCHRSSLFAFLTANTVWAAASGSSCHAIPIKIDYTFNLWAKANLRSLNCLFRAFFCEKNCENSNYVICSWTYVYDIPLLCCLWYTK